MTVICYLFLLWASIFRRDRARSGWYGRRLGLRFQICKMEGEKGIQKTCTVQRTWNSGPFCLALSPLLSHTFCLRSLFLSVASPLSCRGSREQPAASLPQDHHSCRGHRRDHSGCPHRCDTHRGGWLLCQGHEVPGISSWLFRAETEWLGSSEGCTAGSYVSRELGDCLGQVCREGMCLRTWRPGLGLEVGTSHLFPV